MFLVSFVETKKEFKKLNGVNDAEEEIETKKKHLKYGCRWFS